MLLSNTFKKKINVNETNKSIYTKRDIIPKRLSLKADRNHCQKTNQTNKLRCTNVIYVLKQN